MNWLRKKLRCWLGIETNIEKLNVLYSNLTSIGIDVRFKSLHMILIFSRLKGGQIRQIDADFKDLKELNELAKHLKEKYKTKDIFYDLPYGYRRNWIL